MSIGLWLGFIGFVLLALVLYRFVFHDRKPGISIPEALAWTIFSLVLAAGFSVAIFFIYHNHWFGLNLFVGKIPGGRDAALQFITGYLVEESLSLGNVFLIVYIFSYFKIPLSFQHRILYWGIIGAVVMRSLIIGSGLLLVRRLDWITYVFGGMLLFTALRTLIVSTENLAPEKNLFVRLAQRVWPLTPDISDGKFFRQSGGRLAMTPLFLALLMVMSMDALFALDTVPAILAISQDPFIVFSSNFFAVIGLRSLYFALAANLERVRNMRMALSFLVVFIGVKMLLAQHYVISMPVTFAVTAGILLVGLAATLSAPASAPGMISPLEKELKHFYEITYQSLRRIMIILVGSTVILIGIVMLVTPGPGLLAIVGGVTILSAELAWARVLLKRFKTDASALTEKLSKWLKLPKPLVEKAQDPAELPTEGLKK